MTTRIINGECIAEMRNMQENTVDAVITDPPYELGFMGRKWDNTGIAFQPSTWAACLRVMKPGAHLLAFGGSRTFHRMACAIEDAGFEIRDCIMWLYGSGFPKSHNLHGDFEGCGTALKPAFEPIIMARKPLEGTVEQNMKKHGVGALNIDKCRFGSDVVGWGGSGGGQNSWKEKGLNADGVPRPVLGRWPANIIHDGSEEVLAGFPDTKGGVAVRRNSGGNTFGGEKAKPPMEDMGYGDTGSAARFFYCAKASKSDRNSGCGDLCVKQTIGGGGTLNKEAGAKYGSIKAAGSNHHPTVKPTDLMRYLCRLVVPMGGMVLDPFNGSGSTGKAAVLEGFNYIGIERDTEYVEIAKARIAAAEKEAAAVKEPDEPEQPSLF